MRGGVASLCHRTKGRDGGTIQGIMTMFARFAQGVSPSLIARGLRFGIRAMCIFMAAIATEARAGGWQMKQPPLATQWTSQVNTNTPLPEYPRPQMVRSNWLNLNGIWQFEPGITNTDAVPTNQTLSGNILVPYPMESAISGVMAYHAWSWYRTLFTVPSGWSGQRIILHLDAVTWQAQVYVNGQSVGTHKGGYDPFSYDITAYLTGSGPQELIVHVWSPEDNGSQPRGKQTLYPGGIMYTSASGLWQPACPQNSRVRERSRGGRHVSPRMSALPSYQLTCSPNLNIRPTSLAVGFCQFGP